jgi:hypothetical protein
MTSPAERKPNMKIVMVVIALSILTWAADPKFHTARRSLKANQIYVQFETPVALSDCDVEFSQNDAVVAKNVKPGPKKGCPGPAPSTAPWTVVIYDGFGKPSVATVIEVKDVIGNFQANGLLTITLKDSIPTEFSRVDITYDKGKVPHVSLMPTAPPTTHWITPSKTKDDSDVYLSGTFSPAEGTSPSYSIDSKGKYTMLSFGENGSSTLSATGDISTDNKKTADPDSFKWFIPLQRVSPNNYSLQWSLVGMELNKKASVMNLVSAPSFTRAFVHNFVVKDVAHQGVSRIAASIGIDVTGGLEFGDNLRNTFAVANKNANGEGWFLRGVPSAAVYLIIPQVMHLSKITVSSSYTARIPTTDEIFVETRHQKTPVPLLTSQTRNYVENSISFMFSDYFGIQIKHKYGSLPPAFNFVQNSGSVGFIVAFKQTRVP